MDPLEAIETFKQKLIAAGVSADLVNKSFDKTKEIFKSVADLSFDGLTNSLNNLNVRLKSVVSSSGELRNANLEVGRSFDTLSKSAGLFFALTTKFNAFKDLQVTGGSAINTMGSQFEEFVGRFGGWEKASRELGSRGFSSLVSLGKEGAQKMLDAASSAQKLETNYTNLLAASGRLNTIFDEQNNITGLLKNGTIQYATELNNTSTITGENIATVAKLSSELVKVPGVLNTMVDAVDGSGQKINALSKMMQVARGVGIDYSTSIGVMEQAYELLGNAQGKVTDSAEKGFRMMALMNEALKIGGLRLVDTQGFLSTVAKQFEMVGDNTQGAVNILEKFSGALQNTGLTGKASVEIIQNMVQQIGKLEMGTKAMLSMRTGGPGGLQGAFQVENLIRQGKIDEVARMMEQTLRRQFGGRIYTQEEAARSPQAASQFMRQRALMTSGAFGGLAKDDETATRLLEAMKSGPAATSQELKKANVATKDAAQRGQQLQEHQLNVLNMLNNSMDRMVSIGEIQLLQGAREVIGTGGDYHSMVRQSLREYTQSALTDMGTQASPDTSSTEYGDTVRLKQNSMAVANMGAALGVVPNLQDTLAKTAAGGIKAIQQAAEEHKEKVSKNKMEQDVATHTERSRRAAERGSNEMRAVTTRALQQRPRTLVPQVTRATETIKHEVTTKSQVELNLKIEAPDGLKVTGEAKSSDASLITNLNAAAATGLNTVRK